MQFRPHVDAPFPEVWRELLDEWVAFYRHLDDEHRARFEENVRRVMTDYTFISLDESASDARAMLLIAAGAAVLLHGRPEWQLRAPQTIRLHPDTIERETRPVAGTYRSNGDLEFSTRALFHSWSDPADGYNLAMHEFAHAMDALDGDCDGVPTLPPQAIGPWLELLRAEIARLRAGDSVLDRYGAKNHAELFAVAVETFYEKPFVLKRKHRALYEALVELFAVDPLRLRKR